MQIFEKSKTLRYLALGLSALMAASVLLSCANEANTTPTPTPTAVVSGEPTATPTEPEEPRIDLDLPEKTYNKTEFHVLEWTVSGYEEAGNSWVPWEEIAVDDYDGDMINSAIYNRNASVEALLDVKITKEYAGVDNAIIKNKVKADNQTHDNAYQLVTHRTNAVVSFLQEGLLYDMNEYQDDILHMDMPWWTQDAVASFTLGEHLYICASEMLLRDKGATAALFFNKKIAKDYVDLPNFYELIDNHTWTFDEMLQACEVVKASLDNDQDMNSELDMWGVCGGDDPVYFLFNSFGYKFAHIDDDGMIEYDYGTDETLVIMKEIFDLFMYKDWNTNYYVATNSGTLGGGVFDNGKCLFNTGLVKFTTTSLRDMEDDFGIIPYPLYDEDQEEYHSLVWMHHDCVFGIPSATADPEMSAMVVEALSWYSYYDVSDTFYDTVLLDRNTRDDESKRMLKVIFDTRSYDPGQFWDDDAGLHGSDGILRNSYKGTSDMVSMWERWESKTMFNIEKTNKWIQNIDD